MNKGSFDEYLKQIEPSKQDKGYAWHTAIGLQAVDGLKTSQYLVDTAIKNIEGDITIAEAQQLLNTYYEEKPQAENEDRTEEADKVAARIAQILSETAFSFNSAEYIAIHKKLFTDIYAHAGQLRKYNITKKEWVLDGDTVIYGTATQLHDTIEYDLTEEKKFTYRGLSTEDILHHLAHFVASLWQIHAFEEGNTRTTAVFFIKYLRTLGYNVTNDIFAEHAWYFRNALVRANYTNLNKGIHATTEYLERFLENLLTGRNNKLSNRNMHIGGILEQKPNIGSEKANIKDIYSEKLPNITQKTRINIASMFNKFGLVGYFGRSDVEKLLGIKPTRAHELIQMLLSNCIIEPVSGHGKGKYRFVHLAE